MRVVLTCAFVLGLASPSWAATYYVRKDGSNSNTGLTNSAGGAWMTIGKCASTIVAADTCIVADTGTYDERVTETTNGSSGNRITYKASTDCVSNNGATVSGSCPKVRGFEVAGDYITVQGFEFTSVGMTTDANRVVTVSAGADYAEILNNYIHDTYPIHACLTLGANYGVARGNNIAHCYERMQVQSTVYGPYNIVTGVNDKLSFSVQGGATQDVTLTAGAARTVVQIATEIDAAITGVTPCGDPTNCNGIMGIWSDTAGPTSMIELLAIANDAYTTLGMTVGVGSWFAFSAGIAGGASTTDTLVEYNVISYASDCTNFGTGTRVVMRDTTCGPSDDYTTVHIDAMQPGAFTKVLMERVLTIDGTSPDNHFALMSNASADHYIMRFNSTCRTKGGVSMSNGANDLYFYGNTFYDNQDAAQPPGVNIGQINANNGATNFFAGNNIWVNSRSFGPVYVESGTGNISADYDIWFDTPNPYSVIGGGANSVNLDPLVTNAATCDFTLTASSPAIDEGGPLTTVAAGDSGSGTTLVLTDAKAFQDGWALGVEPDTIAVGTVGNIAQIVSIDYTTGTVTIDTDISRDDDDPVWLYSDSRGTRVLYGDAPDMGAFEYQEPEVSAPVRVRVRPPE